MNYIGMNIDFELTIVAVGFERCDSLKRLLTALENARYPSDSNIRLVISLDWHKDSPCAELSRLFQWSHGEKHIIERERNYGLRNHILACGDLSSEFGDIVLFEDDLVPSPYFYNYTKQALSFSRIDKRVAGVSLYTYDIVMHLGRPFSPVEDGFDNFYLQFPSSWGQAWTAKQWSDFRQWLVKTTEFVTKDDGLPDFVVGWSEKSWLKLFAKYIVAADKTIFFPRTSYCTNFGESGTHALSSARFQTSLQLGFRSFTFSSVLSSMSDYDVYFELSATKIREHCPSLKNYDFTVDLRGQHYPHYFGREFVLVRRSDVSSVVKFSGSFYPQELGLLMNVSGFGISLCQSEEIRPPSLWNRTEQLAKHYKSPPTIHLILLIIERFARKLFRRKIG
jgi:hypothetical protein